MVKGHSQYEIAAVLKVSQPTINNDGQFLRENARENLQTHLNDRLPGEYENCMAGIKKRRPGRSLMVSNGNGASFSFTLPLSTRQIGISD